jgi:hypothetical protein
MKKNKANINYQDHPHHEGAQNNTGTDGQPNAHNVSHSHSEMMQDSEEQVRGRKDQPRTERNTSNQREERSEE